MALLLVVPCLREAGIAAELISWYAFRATGADAAPVVEDDDDDDARDGAAAAVAATPQTVVKLESVAIICLKPLFKIKEEMSLKKSYDVKFSFKRGYEAEFKTVRMLGRGAFGSVFLAMRRVPLDPAEPEVFAVKRIKKDMLKSKRHGHALLLEIGELLSWVCVWGSSNPRTQPDSLPPSLPPSSQRS